MSVRSQNLNELLQSIPTGNGTVSGARLVDLVKRPPPPFLFEGFMRSRSITALVAEPHSYKSFIMLAMAISLDFDIPLFGRFKPFKPMKCFFVGSDSPDWDIGQQTHKLLAGYGIKPERRHLLGVEGVFDEDVNILDPKFIQWLDQYDAVEGCDVIFLDSKRSVTGNADENSSKDTTITNKVFKRWRSRGKTVIYAHHTAIASGADGRSEIHFGRGSSDAVAACDFQFNLRNMSTVALGNTRIKLTPAKGRGLASPPDLDIVEAISSPSGEVNAANEPVDALRFIAPSKLGRREALIKALESGPKKIEELAFLVRGLDPSYTEESAYRAASNELQAMKRAGLAGSVARGVWARTGAVIEV